MTPSNFCAAALKCSALACHALAVHGYPDLAWWGQLLDQVAHSKGDVCHQEQLEEPDLPVRILELLARRLRR